jgi:hypothetical protein
LVQLLSERARHRRDLDAREIQLLADEVVTGVDGIATYGLADPDRYTPRRQRELVTRLLVAGRAARHLSPGGHTPRRALAPCARPAPDDGTSR